MKALCRIRVVVFLALLMTPAVAPAQFTFVTNNGAITITGYTGPGGNVIIPSTTNGFPVTSIENWAFFGTSLTSVTIPNSVTNIGMQAFAYCTNLTDVTIPNSVTSIADIAFESCTSLTNVMIGNSVTSIGFYAFGRCTNLITITVETNNPSYSSLAGVLFNKSQTVILEHPAGLSGSYTIPSSVTSIGDYAFDLCQRLISVTISDSVTGIGDGAFIGCSSLANVTIPDSVTSILDVAFESCTSLTNVTIGNGVTNIGSYAFFQCLSLKTIIVDTNDPSYSSVAGVLFNKSQSVIITYPQGLSGSYTIPISVTSIGDHAFDWCNNLTDVMISGGVTNIGSWAFSYCSGLTNVTIGGHVSSIGGYAFYSCSSLTSVYFEGNAPPDDDSSVFSGDSATVYYLPGTSGWSSTFDFRPTKLWAPLILNNNTGFGVLSNRFGFTISWATNLSVVVEACTNLVNPVWIPVATNPLVAGTNYFSDADWTNYPNRFYRVRSP
jgi:hypothetical protein